MNIKKMRNIHLYAGVFFAPLLLFFLLTGTLQTFDLHEKHKNSNYEPAQIIKSLAEVHKNQRWAWANQKFPSSMPFRGLVLLMALGLGITTVLGILMAFKYTKPWRVWVCLAAGLLIPSVMIWMTVCPVPR